MMKKKKHAERDKRYMDWSESESRVLDRESDQE